MRLLLLDAARRRKEQVDLVRLPLDAARSHLHDVNMQVLGDRDVALSDASNALLQNEKQIDSETLPLGGGRRCPG